MRMVPSTKLLAVLLVAAGCGGQEARDEPKVDWATGVSSGTPDSPTTPASPPNTGTTPTAARPTELPPSWSVGAQLGADGPVYVASDPSQFPPALAWQDGVLQPNLGVGFPTILSAWVSGNQRVYVTATADAGPNLPEGTIAFVADIDGPVLNAFFFPKKNACNATSPSPGAAGLFAFNVQCNGNGGRHQARFIAGTVGESSAVAIGPSAFPLCATVDGVFGLAGDDGAMRLYDWTGKSTATFPSAVGSAGAVAVDSAFLWFPTVNLAPNTTPPLQMSVLGGAPLTFLTDVSSSSGIATDGHDMVWRNTALDLMTAPFTFDPSAIAPRKVRGPDTQLGYGAGTVGCGYHAEYLNPTMRVVRLDDATTWAPTITNTVSDWPGPVMAVSCQEIVVRLRVGAQRIRIDSLGTPLPSGP